MTMRETRLALILTCRNNNNNNNNNMTSHSGRSPENLVGERGHVVLNDFQTVDTSWDSGQMVGSQQLC